MNGNCCHWKNQPEKIDLSSVASAELKIYTVFDFSLTPLLCKVQNCVCMWAQKALHSIHLMCSYMPFSLVRRRSDLEMKMRTFSLYFSERKHKSRPKTCFTTIASQLTVNEPKLKSIWTKRNRIKKSLYTTTVPATVAATDCHCCCYSFSKSFTSAYEKKYSLADEKAFKIS